MAPDSHTFTLCSAMRIPVLTCSSASETYAHIPQIPPGKPGQRNSKQKGQNSAFDNWEHQGLPPSCTPTPPVSVYKATKPSRYSAKKFIVQDVSKQVATHLVCLGQPSL